jgi:integrase
MALTPCRDPEVKQAFLFAAGLRISDLERLTWGDIKGDKVQNSL